MAIVEIKVPQLSESVAEATLLQWKKRPGEAVAMDEILIEIETDKVVLEVAMPAAAKLMADNKLAAGSVPGTGKDGRVTKGDVLATLEAPRPAVAAPMAV